MHWFCPESFYQIIKMSEISELKDNSSELSTFNHSVNHCNNDISKEFSNNFNSEILQIVTEMVETISKEGLEGKIAASSEHKQKSDDKSSVNENDVPVRRSNRIRRSVVRKDEFVTPRPSKKSNKNQRTFETSNQKIIVTETKNSLNENNNVGEILDKVLLDNNKTIKGDTKFPKEDVSETSTKILQEKHLKCKSGKKSKTDKVNKKVPQISKQLIQGEKKKTRKRKTNITISDSEDGIKNASESVVKNEEKCIAFTEPDSLVVACTKLLNSVSESESKSETQIGSIKQNKDQVYQTDDQGSDKSVDSCNIKPVKVKSRWWRSSELEAVKNSESVNCDKLISVVKTEVDETNVIEEIENGVKPSVIINVEDENKVSRDSPIPQAALEVSEDTAPPQYDHIDENIYRFNR